MNYFTLDLSGQTVESALEKLKGVAPSTVDDAGATPLVAAVQLDQPQLVDELLKRGYYEGAASFLTSPIGSAITSDKPNALSILRLLLAHGGKFEAEENPMQYCGELNEPMLHAAIRRKNYEAARELLLHGYKPAWRDSDGVSAFELAEEMDERILELFKRGFPESSKTR